MRKFLLVDDDADDASLFEEALKMADDGLQYSWALNGRDAMEKLEKGAIGTPDVIFLDLNMPLVNGWEFLTYLKQHEKYRDIPVVVYTTSSHKHEIEMARSSGASSFLVKPTDFYELADILKGIVKGGVRAGLFNVE